MKILHITANMSPEWGGPTKVVTELTEALARKGIDITIFVPIEKEDIVKISQLKGVKLQFFRQGFPARWWTSYSAELARSIRQKATNFDLIHIHEIWHHANFAAYRAAKKAGKPYIITVHGALEPWCLNYKKLKKKAYTVIFQRRILNEAAMIHAITQEEAKNIRAFKVHSPVTVIPNGINLEKYQHLLLREEFEKLYPELKGKKVVLFMGRIHPVKGLNLLTRAFSYITKNQNNIQLVIVGPDSKGYKTQIKKMLKSGNIDEKTIFTGILTGSDKLAALSRADVFVVPSYSEVRSIVALEAMACSLPVIITRQCQFPEIAEAEAGIVIEPDSKQLAEALNKLLSDPKLCKKMGENGRKLVLAKFTWDKITDEMIKVYKEILSRKDGKR